MPGRILEGMDLDHGSRPTLLYGAPSLGACDRYRARMTDERLAEPGELCTCGRQAVRVYISEQWGEVGDCDIHPAVPLAPCRFCGAEQPHPQGTRCPQYRLRPEPA